MTPEAISFFVPGNPKAQPRPRAFARKMGNKFVARVYDAGTAEGWKSEIAVAARAFLPPIPLTGPLEINVEFLFARPKRLQRKCEPAGRIPHTAKPDVDNLSKAILDALKTLGMFADDAQVCDSHVRKWYVERDGLPGALVHLSGAVDRCDALLQHMTYFYKERCELINAPDPRLPGQARETRVVD